MKCLILAGGKGERLWPLSRKNCPKQFISVQGNHSVFQETVARNIPFCDEFIIVSSYDYRHIITNQMKVFQGISYRVILEGLPRRTLSSAVLACLELAPSEFVFCVSSDLLIDPSDDYKDAVLRAKAVAAEGNICTFVRREDHFDPRYGYLTGLKDDCTCSGFAEKPDTAPEGTLYRNLGMCMFRAGDFLNEVYKCLPDVYDRLFQAYMGRSEENGYTFYSTKKMESLEALSIERSIFTVSSLLRGILSEFGWNELTGIEDLEHTDYRNNGVLVVSDSPGTLAVNNSSSSALVVSGIEDAVVVATEDAVFVGKRDSDLKKVLGQTPLLDPFLESGVYSYRPWGYYQTLFAGPGVHIRKVTVTPGQTIYAHKHETREENWTVLMGTCLVTTGEETRRVEEQININIPRETIHQISNIGDTDVVFIDTAFGDYESREDQLPRMPSIRDLDEKALGIESEPMVMLAPAFKDYLWGGTGLINRYGYKCDFDRVAEAWVLSAHPAGQSTITTGRHKGARLGNYVKRVGTSILGWKCRHNVSFPLLIKMIDARDDLSIQVHPGDEYAMENEGEYGKNEMWYVISSAEGAGLYVGFKRDVTSDEVRSAIADGTIRDLMNFFPTKAGDVFYIPSGTVHAIGAGNLICEVQQSSNSTYRLYDFDRRDKYGHKRELHIDKALDVLDLCRYEPQDISGEGNTICSCKYFEVLKYDVEDRISITGDDSDFKCLVCLDGEGRVSLGDYSLDVCAGRAVFAGASPESIVLEGKMSVLLCHV